jgi:23S rRNA (uridine2552-2'-O)-methyltransferase
MSKLRDRRARHDAYYRRAKSERYAARSVYKLEELDRRFRLLKSGQRVLDLGCRPGSWLQYAAEKVGPRGRVVGLDREPLELDLPAQVRVVVGDLLTIDPALLRGELPCFHTVLSDMAPDTTGIAFTDQVRSIELLRRALELSLEVGCAGGSFAGKVLMGDGFDEVVAHAKRTHQRTKTVRPQATRKESTELYLVAVGRKR